MLRILCFCILLGISSCNIPWPPKTGTVKQPVDHFNYAPSNEQVVFDQIYYYEDKYWDGKDGPIFFYTGNEGEIGGFWNNTGFMFDIAPQFKALIIFGEHRYYGRSLPFDVAKVFHQPYIQFLSVEQALADFAYMIDTLKIKFKAEKSAVISFGGSYGGMLSAYMRFKYPNIVQGAIAASAPLKWVSGFGNPHQFFETITHDANNVNPTCVSAIKDGYKNIIQLANSGSQGLKTLSSLLSVCRPLENKNDVNHLLKWSRNAWVMMAMLDYPYKASFMADLPANPVEVACKAALKSASPVIALRDSVAVFYNSTGSTQCFDIYKEFVECADITGCGLGPSSLAWDFQACTEIALNDNSNQTTDMFPSLPLTTDAVAAYCNNKWGVTPSKKQLALLMWGENINSATNIVFSNGDLDPWHLGGILKNVSNSVISLLVEGGAHHLDLRSSNPSDPPSVVKVRNQEVYYIKDWISQHKMQLTRKLYNVFQ